MSATHPSGQDSCNQGIWSQVLAQAAKRVQPDCFQTWFHPIIMAGHDARALHLLVPNEHFRRCLLENYGDVLNESVGRVAGASVAVEISVASSPESESADVSASGSNSLPPLPVIRAAALQVASHHQNWLIDLNSRSKILTTSRSRRSTREWPDFMLGLAHFHSREFFACLFL